MDAIRPETFSHEKRDCTVRALSLAANITYDRAHEILKELGRKESKGIYFKDVAKKAFQLAGVKAKQVKRSGSVKKLIQLYPDNTLFCLKRKHAFCVKQGKIMDETTQDSHIKRAYLIENSRL